LLLVAGVSPVTAQANPADSSVASKTLFSRRDAIVAVAFTGLTVALLPVDEAIARRSQDSRAQANHFLRIASRDVQYMADPGAIIIGASLYATGRVGRWRNVEDLGLHGFEAVIFSGATTGALKIVTGRARPNSRPGVRSTDFSLGRGWTNGNRDQSFPSGHTTVAFAAAAAVTSESRRWWPRATWLVAPIMYGGATLVGLSRMYNNAHWASDVALGAGIGTFSGLKVVRFSHLHSDNRIDRLFLRPAGDRVELGWSADH
jgi:membrane-associated phospholipid phosphatase